MAAFKKLEAFDGTGDVERFIDRFEFAVTVDELADKKVASYLAMHLNGPAFDVWKGLDTSAQKKAEEIKKALRNTYGIRRSAAWRSLQTFRINAGQQLDAACEELHKLAKIVTSGSDPASSLAALAFVEALPGHVAQRVRVLRGQDATKEEVLESAKDIWDASSAADVTAAVNSSGLQRRGGASGGEKRRCYGCGEIGHLRRNCASVCAKCGGKRHSELFCKSTGNEQGEQ